jgi:photosystem II stability/assembly factor-like uncharacterized protein
MKILIIFLFFIALSSICMSDELIWTPADISAGAFGTLHAGIWFYNDFGWMNGGNNIWITYDAGRNWILSLKAPENRSFYDTYFINSIEGWTVAGIFPSFLFHTKDAGRTWESVELGIFPGSPNTSLIRVYFKDSLNGIGIFQIYGFPIWGGHIVGRTNDGGKTWISIVESGGAFPQLFGFGNGFWAGAFYSSDFGNTLLKLSMPGEPVFLSSRYGWTVGYPPNSYNTILRTTDGGKTWSEPILIKKDNSGFLSGYCLISENIGAALWSSTKEDEPSLLYLTHDGGIIWTTYQVPSKKTTYMLFCNQERKEIWLFPIIDHFTNDLTIYYASIDIITMVSSSNRQFTTWSHIKKEIKEF